MNGLFCDSVKFTLGKDLVADTTAETTSAVADMAGFDEVTFVVKFGDVDAAAVITFAVKENTASSVSSPTPTAVALDTVSAGTLTSGNLVFTEASGNMDDKIVLITVNRSKITKQYIFLSITCTVESYEIDWIGILQTHPRTLPVTQSSDVIAVCRGHG